MSILRTSKFIRYVGSLARNIVLNNSVLPRNELSSLVKHKNNPSYFQYYTTVPATVTTNASSYQPIEKSIDRSIRRLDEDARKVGRISRRELDEVIEELKSSGTATSSQSLMLIRCCGNLVSEETPDLRTKIVDNVWKILENLGIPLDISHYNALLRVYLENEHTFSPTEFLADLERKGIEANRVTYQRLIAGYCQRGDINGATQILEFMREKQMPISEGVFNALVLGHSKAGDMQSARGILQVMGQAGLEPSSDTYAALLCGYANIGDAESIEATIEECEKKDIFLTDRDYLEIVFTLAVNNHNNLIDPILKRVRRSVGYNQDASNIILRLVINGKEDIGLKVLETMVPPVRQNGQSTFGGAFFIKQLVKCNRPLETILKVCDHLNETGLNSRGLLIAADVALQSRNTDLSLNLFKAMKDNFYPIRNHYFWPLIVEKGKQGKEGVFEILKKMSEFKVIPSNETLRDYVLPIVAPNNANDVSKLISDFQSCNISIGATSASLVGYFLSRDNLKLAAEIATSFKANYTGSASQRLVVSAFLKTKDTDSLVLLVNAIVRGRDIKREEEGEDYASIDDREFTGRLLLNIIKRREQINLIELLQKMVEYGLGLSNSAAEQIESHLSGSELTTEVSSLLSQLVSADLPKTVAKRQLNIGVIPRNEESLRKLIKNLEAKGENPLNLKRQLFNMLCGMKDLEKTVSYKKELEAEGFVITTGMNALLIELYLHHNDLESALKEYELLIKAQPDLKLDNFKTIKLATGLVEADRLNDAIDFLKKQSREEGEIDKEKTKERPFVYKAACWRLLNTLAEKGDCEGVKKLFDCLIDNKFIEPNNSLLGPLVKAHLVKDDLKGALEVFEWCCNHYRATPFKNEIMCKLIQKEDAAELQRVTDLSTTVHGEINSLNDLIIAFVECGRVRQARKILETPGLRVRPDKINLAGERYQNEGQVEPLVALLKATKDILQVDRTALYYQLLLAYQKSDDAEKALALWTQMQDEDVQPSEEFLRTLGLFLESKDVPVPFVIPEVLNKEEKVSENIPNANFHTNFQSAIKNKTWPEALKHYNEIKKSNGKFYPNEIAGFLDLALNTVGAKEASIFFKELISSKNVIPKFKLYYFTKSLAKTGDVEAFVDFGNYLTDNQKKLTKYRDLLCNCFISAGKTEELFNNLESKVDEELKTVKEVKTSSLDFPFGGILAILEENPNLIERVENIVSKYSTCGFHEPVNILWIHCLSTGKDAKAEELFNKHLKQSPTLMFRYVISTAKKNNDDIMIDKLYAYLKKWENVNEKLFGIVASSKINIFVNKGDPDKAFEYFKEVLKEIPLDNFNPGCLNRLKSSLAEKNVDFPYDISKVKPSRHSLRESSDSDNEREEIHKNIQ